MNKYLCGKKNTLKDVVVIGEEEGGPYKLKGHAETILVHETTGSSELWNRRLSHINYKALSDVSKVATRLTYLKIKPARDVHRERTSRIPF